MRLARHGAGPKQRLPARQKARLRRTMAKNDLQKISIYYPDNGDFNDMLMNGDQVREVVFYKKQQVAA